MRGWAIGWVVLDAHIPPLPVIHGEMHAEQTSKRALEPCNAKARRFCAYNIVASSNANPHAGQRNHTERAEAVALAGSFKGNRSGAPPLFNQRWDFFAPQTILQ